MADILLVDDDEGTRSLIADSLSLSGHILRAASNGQEFFELYNESQPDLLILDLVMPSMDGLELMRRLAAKQCSQPILIISGYNYISEDGLEILSNGLNFQGLIKKPFDVFEFSEQINAALQSHPSSDLPATPA